MGIPKFFRYMSERYPCLSELVREDQIPEFDNLYLDMNGIIHPCSHPDDGNVHFRISEDTIFRAIFNYIDKLFFLIKPRKLFFMAVDGVAPRAKMNQQRSRRFRSAKDAEILEKNAINRGEKLPDTARFDSNCITPGTEFMVRLQDALKYFVKMKMSSDPLWQRCRIILSGHETPGEGEHKIMEYIRYLKSKPEYDPNTRHCLYGLDADLIVLGLCTHEMHFSLLREEVNFGKKAKKVSIEEIRFYLLHLNLLREYLELEFDSLKYVEGKQFDIHKIIDDWILMGFLVGNDFIPHLPHLHINSNALPLLYTVYKNVWPNMDGYLNDNGVLNLSNFEIFMEKLSEKDIEMFDAIAADLKYLESKRGKNAKNAGVPEAFDFDVNDMKDEMVFDMDGMTDEANLNLHSEELDEDVSLEKEFTLYKRKHYINKLRYPEMTPEVLAEQSECYVKALQWILYYYYRGVSSWGWYYPHHYAPFASDVKNFKHLKLEYNMGKPFLPFEQLLAVLPAASKELLPQAYRDLMTSPDSEIIEYYPKDFETDLNGKKQEWEAVVLIPFIDEEKLLTAMSKRFPSLLSDEKKRNIHGPMLQFDHTEQSQGECPGIFTFKQIDNVYCTETQVWRDQVKVSEDYLQRDASKWPIKRRYLPGFPTLKYLKYTGELQRARVKVFEQPSRNDTMVLLPEIKTFGTLEELTPEYLNKIVYVGWPHLIKSKVCGILTEKHKATTDGIVEVNSKLFDSHLKNLEEHTINRMGIKFRETKELVFVNTLASIEHVVGTKGKMVATCIWSATDVAYPLQGVVTNISVEEDFTECKIEEFFPVGTPVFMLCSPYFGCEGKILDPKLVYNCGRIQVNITVISEPQLHEAKQIQAEAEQRYYNSYELASMSGLPANVIARITGSVFVIHGDVRTDLAENAPKSNIGLNLKSKKSDQQVAGYVRKQGNTWQYSEKTFNLITSYYQNFPEVFKLLAFNSGGNDEFFETTLYPPPSQKKLSDLSAWLKQQSHYNADRVPCGTRWVELEAIEAIKKAVDDLKVQPVKSVKLQVKPHLLLKHGLEVPQAFKSKSKIRCFDRIVVVKKTYQVPVGYKGTVIAIHPTVDSNPVRIECVKQTETFIEVLFDKELPEVGENNDGELKRIARVAQSSILVVYQPIDEHVLVPVENPMMRRQNTKPDVYKPNQNNVISINNSTSLLKIDKMSHDAEFFTKPAKNNKSINYTQNYQQINDTPNKLNNVNRMNISSKFKPPPPPSHFTEKQEVQIKETNKETSSQKDSASSQTKNKVTKGNYLGRSWSPVNDNLINSNGQGQKTSHNPKQSNLLGQNVLKSTNSGGNFNVQNKSDSIGGLEKDMSNLNMNPVKEVEKSTEALRKLLGLNSSSPNSNKSSEQQNFFGFARNDTRNIRPRNNCINFPKPPPNWTTDASVQSNRRPDINTFPHQTPYPIPPRMPFDAAFGPRFMQSNHVQPIQPFNNQYYTNAPVHVDKTYTPSSANSSHNASRIDSNQMCPSRETRVNNISSGPSAFIPLQAMRSIRKSDNPKPSSSKMTESSTDVTSPKNENTKSITKDQKTEMTIPQNPAEETKVTPAPRKIRKPKIAANFNFKG